MTEILIPWMAATLLAKLNQAGLAQVATQLKQTLA
jgi:hypothetical protein